jgi:hypothetical protein
MGGPTVYPTLATKTKTSRGWGTQFHSSWDGINGGRLLRSLRVLQTDQVVGGGR